MTTEPAITLPPRWEVHEDGGKWFLVRHHRFVGPGKEYEFLLTPTGRHRQFARPKAAHALSQKLNAAAIRADLPPTKKE